MTDATALAQRLRSRSVMRAPADYQLREEAAALLESLSLRLASAERETDEALCFAEGPSTLLEMARLCIENGLQRHEAERPAIESALRRERARGMQDLWQPIETAPKDGTVIDVWLQGSIHDIEFYCQSPPCRIRPGTFAGRSAGWMWLDDKWRPYLRGLHLPVFIQPTHWMPLPNPPERRARETEGTK